MANNDLGPLALPDCTPTTVQARPDTDRAPEKPIVGDAKTDKEALVALYNLTGGTENRWGRRDKWLTEAPVWEWYGVTADHNGRVTAIDLRNKPVERGDTGGVGQADQSWRV